jgi:5-formyltetrahydrofolate cyclo-ligase
LSPEQVLATRSELRNQALAVRDAIPAPIRDAYSQLIRKRTLEYLESISAKFVHTYIGFRSEVSTQGLIEDLFERKIKVVVPVIGKNSNNKFFSHSLLDNLDHLQPGKFGVPEPGILKETEISGLDTVIIPIVAFDGEGARLGYGKGYYDRFLSLLPTKVRKIGLAFSIQEMDKIPMMSHDQLMNNIITEQSVFFFK